MTNPSSKEVEPELKACPWCGGQPIMTTGRSAARDAREFYNPSCEHCNYIFQDGFFHIEDAVKAWNTRVPEASTAPSVDPKAKNVAEEIDKLLSYRLPPDVYINYAPANQEIAAIITKHLSPSGEVK